MIDLLLHNLRTIGTHHCDGTVGEEAADEIERLRAEVAGLREDAERLEFIQNEYLHIIPFAMPTGADDSEVGWQVHIEAMNPADGFRHTEYRDNLRAAIDAARKGEA